MNELTHEQISVTLARVANTIDRTLDHLARENGAVSRRFLHSGPTWTFHQAYGHLRFEVDWRDGGICVFRTDSWDSENGEYRTVAHAGAGDEPGPILNALSSTLSDFLTYTLDGERALRARLAAIWRGGAQQA